jgi:hypothetical protein
MSREYFDAVRLLGEHLGTDPNQIGVLHRYGDLDLRKYGQNLSQDAQIRSPRPSRA